MSMTAFAVEYISGDDYTFYDVFANFEAAKELAGELRKTHRNPNCIEVRERTVFIPPAGSDGSKCTEHDKGILPPSESIDNLKHEICSDCGQHFTCENGCWWKE